MSIAPAPPQKAPEGLPSSSSCCSENVLHLMMCVSDCRLASVCLFYRTVTLSKSEQGYQVFCKLRQLVQPPHQFGFVWMDDARRVGTKRQKKLTCRPKLSFTFELLLCNQSIFHNALSLTSGTAMMRQAIVLHAQSSGLREENLFKRFSPVFSVLKAWAQGHWNFCFAVIILVMNLGHTSFVWKETE